MARNVKYHETSAAPGSFRIKVPARLPWVRTPVTVRKGDRLWLRACGHWWDFYIRCGPEGYAAPVFYALGRIPRIVDEGRYFRLMGRIYDTDAAPMSDVRSETFLIGRDTALTAPRDGRLYVFANDGATRYGNNWGAITMKIEIT